jgi:DNA-binding transcriptional regulator LsrR (DeoR family)
MPPKQKEENEVADLLKKILILELFQLGVPQGEIGKKLKMQKKAVNAFLKSVKKNGQKTAEKA